MREEPRVIYQVTDFDRARDFFKRLLGFDETFRRMWSLYLAYSEAGFRTGYLDVNQITIAKPAACA